MKAKSYHAEPTTMATLPKPPPPNKIRVTITEEARQTAEHFCNNGHCLVAILALFPESEPEITNP